MTRPIITNYSDLVAYLADMCAFLKKEDAQFSILKASKTLRKISPTLVSLILKGKRRLTLDRVDEFAKLLQLTPHERKYLRDWVSRMEGFAPASPMAASPINLGRRKITSSHLLSDWINVYVKDAFQLRRVSQHPDEIYAALGGIASRKRIEQSIKFLLKHGYLRTTIEGHVVPETPLHSIDPKVPNAQIRKFHKAALTNARDAIDQHDPGLRYANAMVVTLNESTYKKITELIAEQAEELQSFAEGLSDGDQLYQLVINLSPTGGRREPNQ